MSLVVEALEHDPLFAAEITRLEFDAARPGEERDPAAALLTCAAFSYGVLGDIGHTIVG